MIISKKIYKRILDKKKQLTALKPFNRLQLNRLKEELATEYIYNSTSIEGNTLSLNETKLILNEGITIGGKTLREHLAITNQKEAMDWIESFVKKKKRINEAEILALHRITLKGISDYWAVKYKTSQNRIIGSKLKTAPPYKVQGEMNVLIEEINNNPNNYNAIELAAYAHHEIARIHPFVDGNGRTARLLSNLILMSKGYPPIIIRTKDRLKYFNSLEKAHFGQLDIFINFIALRAEETLMQYLAAFARTTKKNELLPLSILAKETTHSQEYLSLLARRGILPATKINNTWHTTREELNSHLERVRKK